MSKFCRLRRNERYEVCNDEHRGRGLPVCVYNRILRFPLSTPHPLITTKTIREKNICKYRTHWFAPLRTSVVFRIMKP